MKKLNIRKDHIAIVERHLAATGDKKMARNFRKHVNRVKKTKWAHRFVESGEQPKGRMPDFPAYMDFVKHGFDIPSAYCPSVVYKWAACELAVLELYQEFLVTEKNNGEAPRPESADSAAGAPLMRLHGTKPALKRFEVKCPKHHADAFCEAVKAINAACGCDLVPTERFFSDGNGCYTCVANWTTSHTKSQLQVLLVNEIIAIAEGAKVDWGCASSESSELVGGRS